MHNPTKKNQRRGSIYLVTFVTVAAITSMALIGMSLRQTARTKTVLITDMSIDSESIFSSAEFAIETIASDMDWVKNAKSGTVFASQQIGNYQVGATVLDAITLKIPGDTTTNYRITMSTDYASAHQSARFDCTVGKVYLPLLSSLGADEYWALDESKGASKAVDAISNLHGSFIDPSIVGGSVFNSGLSTPFFKINNDEVQIPYSRNFQLPAGTLSFWVKLNGSDGFRWYGIAGMIYQSGGQPTLSIGVFRGSVLFYIDDDGVYSWDHFTATARDLITKDTWHHVAVSWGARGQTIAIDGVLQASEKLNIDGIGTASVSKGGNQPLMLGAGYAITGFTQTKVGFDGSVARVSLFPTQLTIDQIALLAATDPDAQQVTIIDDSWERIFD